MSDFQHRLHKLSDRQLRDIADMLNIFMEIKDQEVRNEIAETIEEILYPETIGPTFTVE